VLDFNQKLRREKYNQDTGYININEIAVLKNTNYAIINMPLDGEAPKQYIKAYIYKSGTNVRKANPKTWGAYFAKFGSKAYPNESVIEYVINKLGENLGLNINETELVVANNQIRFLSRNFLAKNQKLIHGIEVLFEYFEDEEFVKEIDKDKKNRRKYLTFKLIEDAISTVYPKSAADLLDSFIQLLTFDAIVGNNDRHHYNWGFIGDVEKVKNRQPVFAPIYDTARALLWNKTDQSVRNMYKQHFNNSQDLIAYIEKSKPRVSFERNDSANHFELINYLSNYNKQYKRIIENMISIEKEETLLNYFKDNWYNLFIFERSELILEIIKLRFSKLREVVSV